MLCTMLSTGLCTRLSPVLSTNLTRRWDAAWPFAQVGVLVSLKVGYLYEPMAIYLVSFDERGAQIRVPLDGERTQKFLDGGPLVVREDLGTDEDRRVDQSALSIGHTPQSREQNTSQGGQFGELAVLEEPRLETSGPHEHLPIPVLSTGLCTGLSTGCASFQRSR